MNESKAFRLGFLMAKSERPMRPIGRCHYGRIEDSPTWLHHRQMGEVAVTESEMSSQLNRRLFDLASSWPNRRGRRSRIGEFSSRLPHGRIKEVDAANSKKSSWLNRRLPNSSSSCTNRRGLHSRIKDVTVAESRDSSTQLPHGLIEEVAAAKSKIF